MGDESRFRYRRDEGAAENAARARSVAPPAGEGDPLAELARMIGERDSFDDFSALEPEPAPQPAVPRRAAAGQPRYAPASLAAAYAPPPADSRVSRAPARPAVQPAPQGGYDADDDDAEADWQAAPAPQPRAGVPARAGVSPVPAPTAYSRTAGANPYAVPQDATVRQGYGSLARQAPSRAAAQPPRYADEDYDAPAPALRPTAAASASAYDTRAQAARGQPSRAYAAPSSGAQAYAAQPARGYAEPDEDDDEYDAPAPQARSAQPGAQGQAARGYDKSYDERNYDARSAQARPSAHAYGEEDEAAYAYSAARRDDDGYDDYDDSYDPEYADDGYMPPHGDEVYDQEPRRRKGRMALLLGVSVLGLLVAGVAGVFAYNMAVGKPGIISSSGAPPVIKADASPAKTASPTPPAADGQQKLIYDRVGAAAGSEKVVPREEQPVDVTAAVSRSPSYAPADSGPPAAQATITTTEPKKVRTLAVRADGSLATPGSPVSAYAANPAPGGQPLADPTALPAAAPAQTANTNPAPSAAGTYVVQVASQRSEADAMGSFKVLQQRYPNLLGSYKVQVKKADLGDKGVYYRAQVGPFASRDQANDLCQSLRQQGGDCVVTKN